MYSIGRRFAQLSSVGFAVTVGGCVLAAAGAGAVGAVYVTERGAESVVTAPVPRTLEAARQAFSDFGISETKSSSEQEGGVDKRSLEGKTSEREIEVNLKSEGTGTHITVVAKKTAVTWDKGLAKKILKKVVELAK